MFLHGDLITLRPYEPSDASRIFAWVNNPAVTHYMFTGQFPMTEAQVTEMLTHNSTERSIAFFTITDKKTGEAIGYVGLFDIHPTAHKAEMRILIGNIEYWGKGYGTQAVELATYYGFDRLNLHRIFLGFTHVNDAAKGAYERAGYVHEGVLRDDIFRNSRYYDTVRMGLLRDEYYEKKYPDHQKRFSVS